jgi:hypothetical protein
MASAENKSHHARSANSVLYSGHWEDDHGFLVPHFELRIAPLPARANDSGCYTTAPSLQVPKGAETERRRLSQVWRADISGGHPGVSLLVWFC